MRHDRSKKKKERKKILSSKPFYYKGFLSLPFGYLVSKSYTETQTQTQTQSQCPFIPHLTALLLLTSQATLPRLLNWSLSRRLKSLTLLNTESFYIAQKNNVYSIGLIFGSHVCLKLKVFNPRPIILNLNPTSKWQKKTPFFFFFLYSPIFL